MPGTKNLVVIDGPRFTKQTHVPDGLGADRARAAEDDDDPVGCLSPMEASTAFKESSLLLNVVDLDPERSLFLFPASEAELVGALKLLTPDSGDNCC